MLHVVSLLVPNLKKMLLLPFHIPLANSQLSIPTIHHNSKSWLIDIQLLGGMLRSLNSVRVPLGRCTFRVETRLAKQAQAAQCQCGIVAVKSGCMLDSYRTYYVE